MIVSNFCKSRPCLTFLDRILIPHRYLSCSCASSCWGDLSQKATWPRRFKSDWDEILQECFSNEYAIFTHLQREAHFGYDVILSRWQL